MTTRTTTTTTTRTHTATWLAEIVMGTIGDIMSNLGIAMTRFYADWDQDESAIKEWILEGSLDAVCLECHQPSGKVAPIIEFPVQYTTSGAGDADFMAHRASLARFRTKLESVPVGTSYRLFCTFNGPHSSQPGWCPGQRASTDGLRSTSVGTIATAPEARASMRYYR